MQTCCAAGPVTPVRNGAGRAPPCWQEPFPVHSRGCSEAHGLGHHGPEPPSLPSQPLAAGVPRGPRLRSACGCREQSLTGPRRRCQSRRAGSPPVQEHAGGGRVVALHHRPPSCPCCWSGRWEGAAEGTPAIQTRGRSLRLPSPTAGSHCCFQARPVPSCQASLKHSGVFLLKCVGVCLCVCL